MDTRETNRRNAKRRVLAKSQDKENIVSIPTNTPALPEQPRRGLPAWAIVLIVLGVLALLSFCCVSSVGMFLFHPLMVPANTESTPVAVAPTTEPVVINPTTPLTVCPNTTQEAQELFGVSVQRIGTEACGWVWRGKPVSHVATCPSGYACTWDVVNDVTVVHLGVGQSADIYAGTFRLISAYPANDAVHDICSLYQKEIDFAASEIPTYEVRFQPVDVGPQTCPLP